MSKTDLSTIRPATTTEILLLAIHQELQEINAKLPAPGAAKAPTVQPPAGFQEPGQVTPPPAPAETAPAPMPTPPEPPPVRTINMNRELPVPPAPKKGGKKG